MSRTADTWAASYLGLYNWLRFTVQLLEKKVRCLPRWTWSRRWLRCNKVLHKQTSVDSFAVESGNKKQLFDAVRTLQRILNSLAAYKHLPVTSLPAGNRVSGSFTKSSLSCRTSYGLPCGDPGCTKYPLPTTVSIKWSTLCSTGLDVSWRTHSGF